jgi:predicted ATPase
MTEQQRGAEHPRARAAALAIAADALRGVHGDALVRAVLRRFPGAEIIDVRGPRAAERAP